MVATFVEAIVVEATVLKGIMAEVTVGRNREATMEEATLLKSLCRKLLQWKQLV